MEFFRIDPTNGIEDNKRKKVYLPFWNLLSLSSTPSMAIERHWEELANSWVGGHTLFDWLEPPDNCSSIDYANLSPKDARKAPWRAIPRIVIPIAPSTIADKIKDILNLFPVMYIYEKNISSKV